MSKNTASTLHRIFGPLDDLDSASGAFDEGGAWPADPGDGEPAPPPAAAAPPSLQETHAARKQRLMDEYADLMGRLRRGEPVDRTRLEQIIHVLRTEYQVPVDFLPTTPVPPPARETATQRKERLLQEYYQFEEQLRRGLPIDETRYEQVKHVLRNEYQVPLTMLPATAPTAPQGQPTAPAANPDDAPDATPDGPETPERRKQRLHEEYLALKGKAEAQQPYDRKRLNQIAIILKHEYNVDAPMPPLDASQPAAGPTAPTGKAPTTGAPTGNAPTTTGPSGKPTLPATPGQPGKATPPTSAGTATKPGPAAGNALVDDVASRYKHIPRQTLLEYDGYIRKAATLKYLSPALIYAIIEQESRFNPNARSKDGAVGLMQLMPDAAQQVGVTDRTDPEENIMGGARYLRWLIDRHKFSESDLPGLLGAYNAGPTAMKEIRNGQRPMEAETKNYIDIVSRNYRHYRSIAGGAPAGQSAPTGAQPKMSGSAPTGTGKAQPGAQNDRATPQTKEEQNTWRENGRNNYYTLMQHFTILPEEQKEQATRYKNESLRGLKGEYLKANGATQDEIAQMYHTVNALKGRKVTAAGSWNAAIYQMAQKRLQEDGRRLRYRLGGKNPDSGWLDCSGFVVWVVKDATGVRLEAGTSGIAVDHRLTTISKGDLQPGDLLVRQKTKTTSGHVMIYAGNSEVIDMSSDYNLKKRPITKAYMAQYTARRFTGGGQTGKAPTTTAPAGRAPQAPPTTAGSSGTPTRPATNGTPGTRPAQPAIPPTSGGGLKINFPKESPNSTKDGGNWEGIVLHSTVGEFSGAVSWLLSKKSKASAHFVVSRLGEIQQLVPLNKIAWHAGESNWKEKGEANPFTIGIEMENDNKGQVYPPAQLQAVAALCRELMKKYPRISVANIVGHRDVAPRRKSDPVNFPWATFRKML